MPKVIAKLNKYKNSNIINSLFIYLFIYNQYPSLTVLCTKNITIGGRTSYNQLKKGTVTKAPHGMPNAQSLGVQCLSNSSYMNELSEVKGRGQ